MDLIGTLITAGLFWAFVPGVLFTIPVHRTKGVVMVVHALLFALSLHYAMEFYQPENFANYGPAGCPKTHMPGVNQGGLPDCVADPSFTAGRTSRVIGKEPQK